MKKILVASLVLASVIAYGANDGANSDTVSATATVIQPIIVKTGPNTTMNADSITFGTIVAGNYRNTWEALASGSLPDGVGPGSFEIEIKRPTNFADPVHVDYYLEDKGPAGIGKVTLLPANGATGGAMEAQLYLADDKILAAAPTPLTDVIWGYSKDLGQTSLWGQYVHASLVEAQTDGREGDFEGEVTVNARYSDITKNPWRQ